MLAHTHRLTVKAFAKAFANGKRINTPDIRLVYTPSSTLHVAVVVSGSVTKSKPVRNLLKRRMYHLVREHHFDRTGTYIFLMQKSTLTHSYAMLSESLTKLIALVR